jgi:hypothetical protein
MKHHRKSAPRLAGLQGTAAFARRRDRMKRLASWAETVAGALVVALWLAVADAAHKALGTTS